MYTGQGGSGRDGLGRGVNICTGSGGAGRRGLGRGVNVCTGQVGAGRGGNGRGVNAYMCLSKCMYVLVRVYLVEYNPFHF